MVIVRSKLWALVFAVLAGLFVMGHPHWVIADKNTGGGAEKAPANDLAPHLANNKANELLKSIDAIIQKGKGYEAEMQSASKEDLLVLTLQMHQLRERILKNIHMLSEALLEMEQKGPQPEFRKKVEDIYNQVTPNLWAHIEQLEKQIDAARAQRTEAKAEERFSVENTIDQLTQRLNTFYELSLAHIQEMEKIGMEKMDAKDTFATFLSSRADKLSGRLELAVTRVALLEKELAEFPGDADVTSRLNAARSSLDVNTTSLEIVLALMEELDLNVETLRAQLVTLTRDLSSGLSDTGVAMTLMKRWMEGVITWFSENGSGYLVRLLIALGILAIFRIVTRIGRVALEKALDTSKVELSELARRMLISWTSKLVMLFGIMLALSQLGISLGPLLAGLGVAGS